LGPLRGIDQTPASVRQPLPPSVDPPLPWPGPSTAANDAAIRALAIARTFHAAHAIDWCNRFHAGAPDGSDLELLRSHVHVLQGAGIGGDALAAACRACETFVSRSLRVGTDQSNYDTTREPLCFHVADDAASPQYVFQPGSASDDLGSLAARYCGCGTVTVTVDPSAPTVAPSGTLQFAATVLAATDQRVTWTILARTPAVPP